MSQLIVKNFVAKIIFYGLSILKVKPSVTITVTKSYTVA